MMTYRIEITQVDGPAVAKADGDLDAMAYHVRRAKAALSEAKEGTEFSVFVAATTEIGGPITRTVAAVTADGEVAAYVLTKRIQAERKAVEPVPAE